MMAQHEGSAGGFRLTGKKVLAILVGFFSVIIAVNMVMAYVAVTTFSGMQTQRPYEAGLKFNHAISQARVQQEQHWKVDTHIERTKDGQVTLSMAVADQQGTAIVIQSVSVQLVSPVDSRNDAAFALVAEGPGRYRGLAQAAAGQWDLVIEAKRTDDAVFRSVSRVSLH
jgi:nitrogen fixation protein FixH